MRKISKIFIIALIIFVISLSALNIISVDNLAISRTMGGRPTGTLQSNGDCVGEPLNCGGIPNYR